MNIYTLSKFKIQFLAVVLLLLGVFGCTSPGQPPPTATPMAETGQSSTATPATTNAAVDAGFSGAVRQVSEEVKGAVVQITNEQVQVDQFNQPFTIPAGVGSGIVYDAQGLILTNNHVVEGAQKLLASFPDGRSFPAKLVGRDPLTDLAVIKIEGSNLPVAQLGDSKQLQVGDWVVAIGNALALNGGPTVSAGVISALGRTIQEPSSSFGAAGPFLFDVIQTDAPINPGNSGGPLVNLAGQVVGINTLVAGSAGPGLQAQGIGFAISINTAKPIADQLVATGKVIHPSLGISYVPLNPAISAMLGVQEKQGVVVTNVTANSSAAQAGLQPRDVITKIDGQALQDDSALSMIIHTHKPGDTLTLTVMRGSQELTMKVTLGELPSP